jgi:multiple sugar transport system substrate-binding protein
VFVREVSAMSNRRLCTLIGALALLLPVALGQSNELVIAGRDGPQGEAMNLAIDLFREQHPEVRVELLELPYDGLYESLVVSLRERAGAYDVVLLDDTWAPEFMGAGWLRDLEEMGLESTEGFVQSALDASRHPYREGTLYAVPHIGNVQLFAYRSDLFQEHGLERPRTWDDVVEAARTISSASPELNGVVFRGIKGNPIVTGFLPILWAYGGDVVDAEGRVTFDSPESVAALERFLSLKEFAPRGIETYNATEVRDSLQQGDAAMAIEVWPAWIPDLDNPQVSEVVGQIEIIGAPGQEVDSSPMLGSWLLAIPRDAPNPELALEFLEFLGSEEVQKRLTMETGLPPTLRSVYQDDEVVGQYRWYPAQLEALENARARPRIPEWSRIEAILGDYLQFALIGQMDAERAVSEAHRRIEAALR